MADDNKLCYSIRPIENRDFDVLLRLRSDIAAVFWSGQRYPPTNVDHLRWWQNEAPQQVILVAETDQQVIGYSRVKLFKDAVISFAVDTNYRGLGIGTALLKECEQVARQKDADHLMATVHPSNIASIQAFLKAGYSLRDTGFQEVSKMIR